jgi:hypothetical protein
MRGLGTHDGRPCHNSAVCGWHETCSMLKALIMLGSYGSLVAK